MARWRQIYDEETETSTFVPIDAQAISRDQSVAIHGDITPFVSPVDGTVISDRKQLREHNKRNNVVNASEFSQEFYDKKAAERARFYNGEHSRQETLARKQEIYELIVKAEREG